MPGNLDHSPADILRHLLINISQGTLPTDNLTWPVYTSQQPDKPDNLITTLDFPGPHQGRAQVDGEVQERHGVTVRVRAANHVTGYLKARQIAIALDQQVYRETVTIDTIGYTVHAVSRDANAPSSLGKDVPGSKRDLFTIDTTISVRKN